MTSRLLPLALLAAVSCGDDLAPQYRVLDLRILGVRSEVVGEANADVAPGETLRLEALVANPLGHAPLRVRWFACAPTGTDAVPSCVDEEFLKDPVANAERPGSGVVALGEGEAPPPIPVVDVAGAVDAAIRRALAEPTYQCLLFAEIPVVVVAEAAGRREVALKRVRLTPAEASIPPALQGTYVRNVNPSIADMARGPTEQAACGAERRSLLGVGPFPAGRGWLCGLPDDESRQRYNRCGPAGVNEQPEESLSWQWYTSGGEFFDVGFAGNATGGTIEFERPAGPFTVWGILRDGRGGEDWERQDFAALP